MGLWELFFEKIAPYVWDDFRKKFTDIAGKYVSMTEYITSTYFQAQEKINVY